MDETSFDTLARSLGQSPSRRAAVRGLAASALAVIFGVPAAAARRKHRRRRRKEPKPDRNALGCLNEGSMCDQRAPQDCCSGSCARQGDKSRCSPLPPEAFGCTNSAQTDSCTSGNGANCPDHGGICIVDERDVPLCVANISCADCATDADCAPLFGATARCLQSCTRCNEKSGGAICVLPVS